MIYPRLSAAKEEPMQWQQAGLTYTASGYGVMPTRYMVVLADGPQRWRRVWSVHNSNAGSLFIRVGRKRVFIDSSDIEQFVRP